MVCAEVFNLHGSIYDWYRQKSLTYMDQLMIGIGRSLYFTWINLQLVKAEVFNLDLFTLYKH